MSLFDVRLNSGDHVIVKSTVEQLEPLVKQNKIWDYVCQRVYTIKELETGTN